MKKYLIIACVSIGIFLTGCKKEEKPAAASIQPPSAESIPRNFSQEAEKDLREIKRLAQGGRNKALAATTQSTFSQWANGVLRYKQVYGYYPNIGSKYNTTADSIHSLELGPGVNFVKSLSAKDPAGATLSGGSTGDRAKFNRNAEEFCSFARDDFEDPGFSGNPLTVTSRLVNRFGNNKIRVIFDTDGDGVIRNIQASDLPDEIGSAASPKGISARIIIYTKGENGAPDVVIVL
jgi:hypothetical protein